MASEIKQKRQQKITTVMLVQRLRELGWVDGRNIHIEYRWAEGRNERFTEFAEEFVRLRVDIIVTAGSPLLAVKQATSVIPIVFAVANDPLGIGAIASLARPGGNITGISLQEIDLGGKRLDLLREVVPNLRRLAILGNVSNPAIVLEIDEVQAGARTLGLETVITVVRRAEDITPGFEALKDDVDALYICTDPVVLANRGRIIALTQEMRLPTILGFREFVKAGCLMSYGPNYPYLFRRAGDYVDKILRGAKPADIPVEQPTKFDLVVNLATAKTLGLTIPPTLLATADEVIE